MLSERAEKIGLKELSIFDSFEIDYNLPKFIIEKKSNNIGNASWMDSELDEMEMPAISLPTSGDWNDNTKEKLTFRQHLLNYLSKNKKEIPLTKQITVLQFFASLSCSLKELEVITEISEHYEKALIQSKSMGQIALYAKLKSNLQVIRGESQLISINLNKYVDENQLIEFYEKVGKDKNLKLTWIKNFSRIIPEEIVKMKNSIDERKIFDNYVILHYDPENNSTKLTPEEIQKKKDPIIFGLIQNSRKLYYIADWKDDYCQLTLEEMFRTLGSEALTINNKNVKSFIDNLKA